MTLLLAAEDDGLGALFFGVFKGERELRRALGVPAGARSCSARSRSATRPTPIAPTSAGRSASRPARDARADHPSWRLVTRIDRPSGSGRPVISS